MNIGDVVMSADNYKSKKIYYLSFNNLRNIDLLTKIQNSVKYMLIKNLFWDFYLKSILKYIYQHLVLKKELLET